MARGDYNRIAESVFINRKYGRLTVTKEVSQKVYPSGASFRRVLATCECGVIKEYNLMNILHGKSQSCGCYNIETPPRKTHGMTGTPLYRVYSDIKTRCYNENSTSYEYYGKNKVIMCDEWLNNPKSFIDWALKNGWKKELEIDKDIKYKEKHGVSPGKIYSPEYCCFVTHKENSRNRKSNLLITFNGETKIAAEWAEEYGISQDLFELRRNRGWDIKKCLIMPSDRTSKEYKIKNKRWP